MRRSGRSWPDAIGPHQVLHDAVELASARGVGAGRAESRNHSVIEQLRERRLVGRVEQPDAGDQLGGRGVREQVVGDPDAVDQPTFGQTALVEARVQLERGHHDVPTHRLAVDDRPAGMADLAEEELAQREQILDEQVRPIFPVAIAGGRPGVAFSEDVSRERRRPDVARPHTSLDPVGEDHEPAFPVGRHLDLVARAAKRARPADGPALRVGARSAGPGRGRRDDRQAQHHESGEQPAHRRELHRRSPLRGDVCTTRRRPRLPWAVPLTRPGGSATALPARPRRPARPLA